MKYYLIAGEASGDLHASHLMQSLKQNDPEARFRFFGGDMMAAVGGTLVKHYREMAYMGFVPVLLHLRTIFRNMDECKRDIMRWNPDAVILVDYPGFNLKIARFVHSNTAIKTFYYISPKIWAWKEWRIKDIKRDIDGLFSILPFEKTFFEQKHHYPICYVGNPTANEVDDFLRGYHETAEAFRTRHQLQQKPIIALLAGSRKQEIKDNLPAMLQAASRFSGYQTAIAGAPGISPEYYSRFTAGSHAPLVMCDTYALLAHSAAALVTSGTATLETAMFKVPQVVCYKTPLPHIIAFLRKRVLHVPYISLVNLIADSEVVTELVADTFSVENMEAELAKILPGGSGRDAMAEGYGRVEAAVGTGNAPENAARQMVATLKARP